MRRSWTIALWTAMLALGMLSLYSCGGPPRIARLTVIVSGNTEGYLRNCGCSSGQAGGEVRKARMVKLERAEGVKSKPGDKGLPCETVAIDIGNFSNSRNKVARTESAGIVKSMQALKYDAVGIGQQELMYPQPDLLALIGSAGLPLTVANLQFVKPTMGEDCSAKLNQLFKPYIVVTTPSKYRIGLIHTVDDHVSKRLGAQTGFTLTTPAAAAEQVLKEHGKEADCWLLSIADGRGQVEDVRAVSKLADVALIIGAQRESALADTEASTSLPRVLPAPFERAKDILRVSVFFDSSGKANSVLSEQVMIPDTIQPDEYVQQIIDELQPDLERMANADAEVEDQPGVHPRYMGYSTCGGCHQPIVNQLASSRHTGAYETLVQKSQQKSAACLPCHVVGYNKAGGWNILKNTERPEMRGVQCESCHGPGEYHAAVMQGKPKPDDFTADGRGPKGIIVPKRDYCIRCHDADNSQHFDFETYWAKIKH